MNKNSIFSIVNARSLQKWFAGKKCFYCAYTNVSCVVIYICFNGDQTNVSK